MKPFYLLLCFCPFFLNAQPNCDAMLAAAQKADKDGNYRDALLKYIAAKKCNPASEQAINKQIIGVFDKIDNLRKEAIRQAGIAGENAKIAEKNAQTAREAYQAAAEILTNDLLYRAEVGDDRTANFRLLEFAHKISPDNHRVLEQLYKNYYQGDGSYYITLAGHSGNLHYAEFSPDDKMVVTASGDNTAAVWEVATGKVLLRIIFHDKGVRCARFSHDGKYVATGSSDEYVKIYEIESGKSIFGYKFCCNVRSLDFSPDNNKELAVGLDNGEVRIIGLKSTKHETIKAHQNEITTVSFSNDGKRILTASLDHRARVFDAVTLDTLLNIAGHEDAVRSAFYSPDGKQIVTASNDNSAKVWDAETGALLRTFSHKGNVRFADFSPLDGGGGFITAIDTRILIWNKGGSVTQVIKGNTNDITSVRFSHDGSMVISASEDNTAKIWFLNKNNDARSIYKPLASKMIPDEQRVLSDTNGLITITGANNQPIRSFMGNKAKILSANLSMDRTKIITASADSLITIWDASNGKKIYSFQCNSNRITNCEFSSNGQYIFYCLHRQFVKVHKYPSLELYCNVSTYYPDTIFFNGDAPQLVMKFKDKYLSRWIDCDSLLAEATRQEGISQLTPDRLEEFGLESGFKFTNITPESLIKEQNEEKLLFYGLYFAKRYRKTINKNLETEYRAYAQKIFDYLKVNGTIDKWFYTDRAEHLDLDIKN